MPNMNYVRFENTACDLGECIEALEGGEFKQLSADERDAARDLLDLCKRYVGLFAELGIE